MYWIEETKLKVTWDILLQHCKVTHSYLERFCSSVTSSFCSQLLILRCRLISILIDRMVPWHKQRNARWSNHRLSRNLSLNFFNSKLKEFYYPQFYDRDVFRILLNICGNGFFCESFCVNCFCNKVPSYMFSQKGFLIDVFAIRFHHICFCNKALS